MAKKRLRNIEFKTMDGILISKFVEHGISMVV
jgi:hypothetical protein